MSPVWCPSADIETLAQRARVVHAIRAFFMERSVLEVETPILSQAANTDPRIESIKVCEPGVTGSLGWLHTSPEFAMKRLLAAGIGDCYQIARVFRAGECGRRHNPEFSLLEWYRIGFDSTRLMDEVADLCASLGVLSSVPARMSYRDVFRGTTGLDPHACSRAELVDLLLSRSALPEGMAGADRSDLLGVAFAALVEPTLGAAVFVTDFPACQASLARLRVDAQGVEVADRFELYLDGMELANGFRELCDAQEQRSRFEGEMARRGEEQGERVKMDENLIAALEYGLPDCSGVALGLDRLVMLVCGKARIEEVIAFSAERA